MRSLRSLALLTLLLTATSVSFAAHAATTELQRADQMRAAYLFNFLKFVELPAATASTIRICFVGAESVHEALSASIDDKKLGTRLIVATLLPAGSTWAGCDVVYVGETADVRALMQHAAGHSALTVSEANEFTRSGGIIHLFTENNRLRFEVNVANARRAGLKISSDLLRLASRVEQETEI